MEKIIIASGPVIIEDEKVLLNKHGDTPFWKFCGGRIDNYNHRLDEHAQLRAFDEMGIKIEIINPTPFILHTTKETKGGTIDVILVHFLAKRAGEITPREDIKEWRWIPIVELSVEQLAPNIIPTLKHFKFIK